MGPAGIFILLQPQKDLPPVKETAQNKRERHHGAGDHQLTVAAIKLIGLASHQALGYLREIDQVMRHVDGNGIHANPNKGFRPFAVVPDINNEIEGRQQ